MPSPPWDPPPAVHPVPRKPREPADAAGLHSGRKHTTSQLCLGFKCLALGSKALTGLTSPRGPVASSVPLEPELMGPVAKDVPLYPTQPLRACTWAALSPPGASSPREERGTQGVEPTLNSKPHAKAEAP